MTNHADTLLEHLAQSVADGRFVKLTLSGYAGPEAELKSVDIRKIMVKREEKLSFTFHYKTRDIVKNFIASESMVRVAELLGQCRSATLCTTEADWQYDRAANKIQQRAATQTHAPSLSHDRAKERLIVADGKGYLHDLGITDAQGHVLKTAQDKYRQINKYIEIASKLIEPLTTPTLKIVDMGSGKGYLTFALYDYIANTLKRPAEMVGVEFRADMVGLCNSIAQKAGFTGLSFVQNSIADYDCSGAHVVIALHACDTATDDALYQAITAGAERILVAPCCHKQIRREMEKNAAPDDLEFMLRHGTYRERQAEMVTDGMRVQLLEYMGYRCKLFEFISDAHTPKNVMITAERVAAKQPRDLAVAEEIAAAKRYFGIGHHHLEKLLGL